MIEQNCRHCEDWRKCVGKEGFLFAHLIFCPFQIFWILRNSDFLDAGKFPPQYELEESPRTDRRVANEGYFVKPKLLIAEVRARLETTGVNGELLESQARHKDNIHQLGDRAWEALMYVSGWRRKAMPFNAWSKQRRYRSKITNE